MSISEIINLFGVQNVPLNEYFYLRQNLATVRNYGSNTPYILSSETFHSLTNPIWLKISAPVVLPVELVDFNLEVFDIIKINLSWETASELNNLGFEVQRSTDAQNWESIGWVDGVGNSNTLIKYSFTDFNPYYGVNYYRLKQIDHDGNSEFSKILFGEINTEEAIFIYPNPVNERLYIQSGKTIDNIIIYDVLGNKIAAWDYNISKHMDVSSFVNGMYFLEIYSNHTKVKDYKFIKN